MSKRLYAGDTIVEVMLALAILSAVLFTSWGLTTRAIQQRLAARQRIEMVNQMKEQAEIIKSVYAANNGVGNTFKTALGLPGEDRPSAGSTPCQAITDFQNPSATGKFYLTADASGITSPSGTKKVNGKDEQHVWVQYDEVTVAPPGTSYIDFYVRACWQTFGGIQKTDLSEFVVRLNL